MSACVRWRSSSLVQQGTVTSIWRNSRSSLIDMVIDTIFQCYCMDEEYGSNKTQRIPRAQIQRLVSEAVAASAGQRAVSEPRVRFLMQVRGTAAKISPLILSYPLARCYLHTLSASDSPSLGPSLSRPHKALIRFAGADAPAAVGDGTLWVSAEIQYHQQHVRDPLGLPGQRPRVLRTSAGEFYDAALRKVADPSAEILPTHHGTPALSAFAVHVGNMGELVDRLFLDDFSQYAPPFVDSIATPSG